MKYLIQVKEDYYIGKHGAASGIFKKEESGDMTLVMGEHVLSTELLPAPTDFIKEAPSFCIVFPERVIQNVILRYQALLQLVKVEVDLPQVLTKIPYRQLTWFKDIIFKKKSLFTRGIFENALKELVYFTTETVSDASSCYIVEGDKVRMKTDANEPVSTTLSYGYMNALYDIYTQMAIHLYGKGQITHEALLETEYNVQEIAKYVVRDYTLYFLERETTSDKLKHIQEVSEMVQAAEKLSNDTLMSWLHEAGLVETYEDEESGLYVVETDLALLTYMFTPNGLLNFFEGFDVLKIVSATKIFYIKLTDKQVNVKVGWEEFINMLQATKKLQYNIGVVDEKGISVKLEIKRL